MVQSWRARRTVCDTTNVICNLECYVGARHEANLLLCWVSIGQAASTWCAARGRPTTRPPPCCAQGQQHGTGMVTCALTARKRHHGTQTAVAQGAWAMWLPAPSPSGPAVTRGEQRRCARSLCCPTATRNARFQAPLSRPARQNGMTDALPHVVVKHPHMRRAASADSNMCACMSPPCQGGTHQQLLHPAHKRRTLAACARQLERHKQEPAWPKQRQ